MKVLIIDKEKNSVEVNITPDMWKLLNVDISKANKNNTQVELNKRVKEFVMVRQQ